MEQNKKKNIDKRNKKGPEQTQLQVGQIVYKSSEKLNKKENTICGPYKIL